MRDVLERNRCMAYIQTSLPGMHVVSANYNKYERVEEDDLFNPATVEWLLGMMDISIVKK